MVSGNINPCILNFSTQEGKWSAPHFGHFTPRERVSITHWIGSRASMDAVTKRKKNPVSTRIQALAIQPIA
jgi:hypothetical protein